MPRDALVSAQYSLVAPAVVVQVHGSGHYRQQDPLHHMHLPLRAPTHPRERKVDTANQLTYLVL